MADFTQRHARFKLVGKRPERYRDLVTGELLTRTQMQRRRDGAPPLPPFGGTPGGAPRAGERGSPPLPRGADDPADEVPEQPAWVGGLPGAADLDAPEAPPAGAFAGTLAETAHAAMKQERRPGLAESAALGLSTGVAVFARMLLPERKAKLIPDPELLANVARPLGRIADRHAPVSVTVNEDGEDLLEAVAAASVLGVAMYAGWQEARREDELEREYQRQLARSGDGGTGRGGAASAAADAGAPWGEFTAATHSNVVQFGPAAGSPRARFDADAEDARAAGGTARDDTAPEGHPSPARAVAGLLHADAAGRRRLGLGG